MTPQCPHVIHRSSVNAWECDENGHLNVRYFISKNFQGLIQLLAEVGLDHARLTELGREAWIENQHVRFHREARMAAPLIIRGQLVAQNGARIKVYSELRNSMDETLYTTFNTDIAVVSNPRRENTALRLDLSGPRTAVPEYGTIRSLHAEDAPVLSIDDALAMGYVETGRGAVLYEECDIQGRLEFYQYAARIADAIPNFMATMQSEEEFALRSAGKLGGAVIESRADYYRVLENGSRFVILSGLRSFTSKTQRLSHLIFSLDTGSIVVHSQGIAVALDLQTRRAVSFSDDRKSRMAARQLRESP